MFQRIRRGKSFLAALLVVCLLGIQTKASADADLQFAKYLQFVKWSGDYRLRYDNEHFRHPSATFDRPRFRMRLRIATDFGFPGNLTLKTRLASGVGEQTSTNQTFGSLGDQKGIWIDRAYLEWKAKDWMTLTGGRMAMPLWTQYSSDAIWDADLNPEGTGESFSYLLGGINLFANAMQFVADESNGTTHAAATDQYIFSEQVGFETHLPFESRFKVAYANHNFRDANLNAYTGVAALNGGTSVEKTQEGNRKIGGLLANNFRVSEVTGELSSWLFRKPLSIQGTYLKNTQAGIPGQSTLAANLALRQNEKKDTGYQVGAILGKASQAKTWEIAYFYKYLAADATLADAADSDFGDGGTNRRGHIGWIAFAPYDYLVFQAKYFQTKNVDPMIASASPTGTIDRVQVDASVKF
jgi:hypothetical protein